MDLFGKRYFSCGRDILGYLSKSFCDRKRIHVPYFYCPNVVEKIIDEGLFEVSFYGDYPDEGGVRFDTLNAEAGDIALVVNFFGNEKVSWRRYMEGRKDLIYIEDFSHNPGSEGVYFSCADYKFASLRKVFPVYDGGYLVGREIFCDRVFGGMSRFGEVVKESFGIRDLRASHRKLLEGERILDFKVGIDLMSEESYRILEGIDIKKFFEFRSKRFWEIADKVRGLFGVEVINGSNGVESRYFPTFIFEREEMRLRAVEFCLREGLKPMIYWKDFLYVDDVKAKDISKRILSIIF